MNAAIHLWQQFELFELTENMRQKEDDTFKNLLNALRVGAFKPEQLKILLDKVKKNPSGEFALGKAVRIYPTLKMIDAHTNYVLCNCFSEVTKFDVLAIDRIIDSPIPYTVEELKIIIPEDPNKTGSLCRKLTIFEGARVMLRYNLNQEKGLVNGAMGIIKQIQWPHYAKTQLDEYSQPKLLIDFEGINEHWIEPKAVQFPAKYSRGTVERIQLPVILCFACTVHKMQGATVNHAVINLGSNIFAAGQAYVALSRVRSLDGLILEELDASKVVGKNVCNTKALVEMERMRKVSKFSNQ